MTEPCGFGTWRAANHCARFEGHKSPAVAVTPDGRRAVSASGDGTLRVWDLDSGQSLCTLEGHTRSVRAVAVTPDGAGRLARRQDPAGLGPGKRPNRRTLEGHPTGPGRGGNARRPSRRLGLGRPNFEGLGPGERPNRPHARRP